MAVDTIVSLSGGFRLVGKDKVLDPKTGVIYTLDEYETMIESRNNNRLDWVEIDAKDAEDILSDVEFSVKFDVSDPKYPNSTTILIVDKEGVVSLLRINRMFGGAVTFNLASDIELRYGYYLIEKFKDDGALKILTDFYEKEVYPELANIEYIEDEPFYNEKGDKFTKKELVINNEYYRFIYKNDSIYSVKVKPIVSSSEVGEAGSKDAELARNLANGKYYIV